jgi:hypothetical protein
LNLGRNFGGQRHGCRVLAAGASNALAGVFFRHADLLIALPAAELQHHQPLGSPAYRSAGTGSSYQVDSDFTIESVERQSELSQNCARARYRVVMTHEKLATPCDVEAIASRL